MLFATKQREIESNPKLERWCQSAVYMQDNRKWRCLSFYILFFFSLLLDRILGMEREGEDREF